MTGLRTRHPVWMSEPQTEEREPTVEPTAPPGLAPFARWVWAVAGAVTVVLLGFAGRYGYHRDELYFLLCGRHLAWGFIDQPPLTPAIARLTDLIAPGNLVVLRTPSALIAAGCVLLAALIAREVGGGRAAQLLAAVLVATSAGVLAACHLLSTTTPDFPVWLTIILLTLRILRTGDTRWALLIGLVCGVGLLNKYLVGLLAVGLVAGVLIAGPRRLLRDRWVLAGLAIAAVLIAPNVIWQIAHGLPQLDVVSEIAEGNSSYTGRPVALALQLVLVSPLAVVVWGSGLIALFRRPEWRPFRALAWAWVVVFGLLLIGGGKGYYDAPLLLALTAVGSVPTVERLSRSRAATLRFASFAVLCTAINAILMLPIAPASHVPAAVVAVNYDAGETVGWPAMVDSVAKVYRSLPATDRAHATILTANYGEAGALARYGPSRHLPTAYSGHLSVAEFGQPPAGADIVVAVGFDEASYLQKYFGSVQHAGSIDLGVDIDDDENGEPIWICREPDSGWDTLWPKLRRV
jgi:hypothetical protein